MTKKRIFIVSIAFLVASFTSSCSQFDQRRIDTTQQHKQNYVEDVQRALEGKLTKLEFRASLQSFDVSMLEEQGKKDGQSVEALKAKLDADTKKALTATWGE